MSCICPGCSKNSNILTYSQDFNRKIDRTLFTYYRCDSCDLVYLKNIPENLENYYPNDYHHFPHSIEEYTKNVTNEYYKVELLKTFRKKGSLLEVGPSTSGFAYLASKEGFDVEVMEMNEKCCHFYSNVLKIPSICGGDLNQDLPREALYDVIALWHVLEHIPSPWDALKSLVSHLKPNGLLLFAMPNPDAFQFRVLRKYWTHLDAPRHLQLIPMPLLHQKLKDLGCSLQLQTTCDPGSLAWNRFGWKFSLRNFSHNKLIKYVLGWIGVLLFYFFKIIEGKEGKGSAYTMIFQKSNPDV